MIRDTENLTDGFEFVSHDDDCRLIDSRLDQDLSQHCRNLIVSPSPAVVIGPANVIIEHAGRRFRNFTDVFISSITGR